MDITGIGLVACARHGAYVPHAAVDFQKGERCVLNNDSKRVNSQELFIARQMNIDYAICQALKYHTEGLSHAVVLYDIACQWEVHFLKRVKDGPFLSIPDDMEIISGVGKFHLSAHVKECFAKYSPNFIKGLGQVDGEIVETLWSAFNHTSKSARTGSISHRREIYDDHMRDSNWKKLVGSSEYFFNLYFVSAEQLSGS